MARAQWGNVLYAGASAVCEPNSVVQVATCRGALTLREHALLVASDDEPAQVSRRPVGAPTIIDQPMINWVEHQPAPAAGRISSDPAGQLRADGAVPGQLPRLVV